MLDKDRIYQSCHRGLTLVELVVVILAISILITINLILFRTVFSKSNQRTILNELSGSFQVARNIAIHSNKVVYFEFDIEKNYYFAYFFMDPLSLQDTQKRLEQNTIDNDPNLTSESQIDIVIRKNFLPKDFHIYGVFSPYGNNHGYQKESLIPREPEQTVKKHSIVLTPDSHFDNFLIHFADDNNIIQKTLVFEKFMNGPKIYSGEAVYYLNKDGIWQIQHEEQ